MKKPSLFDDEDSDNEPPEISGPPLFKTSQKPTHDQRDRGKIRKPQLFDDEDEDDDDSDNDNGAMKPPILPAVAPKLPPAPPAQKLPPPPASKPGLPPPNAAVIHQRKHHVDDFDDEDDEDDDIGSSDEDDEDDDFDDPKATKAALKEALEENELLKKQLSQKSQLLIKVPLFYNSYIYISPSHTLTKYAYYFNPERSRVEGCKGKVRAISGKGPGIRGTTEKIHRKGSRPEQDLRQASRACGG